MTSVKFSTRYIGFQVDIGNDEICSVLYLPRPNGNVGYSILFDPFSVTDAHLCTALLDVFKHWKGKIISNNPYADNLRVIEVELDKAVDNPRTACRAFGKKLGELLKKVRYPREVSTEPLNRHRFVIDGFYTQDIAFGADLIRFLETQVQLAQSAIDKIMGIVERRSEEVEDKLIVSLSVYAPLEGTFLPDRTVNISKVNIYYLVDRNIWIQFE